jgi:anti-sigma factor RsiW
MTREELEFSICQYLDGTLAEEQRVVIEARLASDPEAQEILREEKRLTIALRSTSVPDVRWDVLADRISGAIDDETERRVARASLAMKIRSPWVMAVAASVGLVVGMALHFVVSPHGSVAMHGISGGTPVAMVIEGPAEDAPAGPVVTEVSIGPGGTYAKAPSLAPYADQMDSRPTRVVIAAGDGTDQDAVSSPSPF